MGKAAVIQPWNRSLSIEMSNQLCWLVLRDGSTLIGSNYAPTSSSVNPDRPHKIANELAMEENSHPQSITAGEQILKLFSSPPRLQEAVLLEREELRLTFLPSHE